MFLVEAIKYLFLLLGVVSLFRPALIVYLFAAVTVASSIPTVPDDIGLKILKIGSINVFVYDYLLLIALFLLLKMALGYTKNPEISLARLLEINCARLALLLLGWSLFIGILSYAKGFQIQNVLRQFASELNILLCLLVPQLIVSDEDKKRFFKYALGLGCAVVLFGLFRYATNEVVYTSSGTARTLQANTLTVLLFGVCYMFFHRSRMRNQNMQAFVFVLVLSVGILLAGYRSGFLVFVGVCAVFFLSDTLRRLDYAWIPLTGIASVFLLVFLIQTGTVSFGQRSFFSDAVKRSTDTLDLKNETTQGRLQRWQKSIEIAKERPVLGLGRYRVYTSYLNNPANVHLGAFSELDRAEHNVFVDKLFHEGLLGLLILLLFFFYIFKDSGGAVSATSKYALFLRVYLASFIFFSMFNTTFNNINGRIFFFIALGFLNAEILKRRYFDEI